MHVAIVEDNRLGRETLKLLLHSDPAVESVEAFGTAESALAKLHGESTDILLTDLNLPGMQGIELIRRVKQSYPHIEILVYTIFEDNDSVFAAIKAGASGYILKGSPPQELMESLRNLCRREVFMSPKIARRLRAELKNTPDLTPREEEVLRFIEQGHTHREIAERFDITPHAVHADIKSIYGKLHMRGQGESRQ